MDARIEQHPPRVPHDERRRFGRCGTIAGCAFLAAHSIVACAGVASAAAAAPATGLQTDIVFTDYSSLSRTPEMVRRLFSPLQAWRMNRAIAQRGDVREQAIDLAREKFALYVPPAAPAAGYGVLVFVPPWEQATVPASWTAELDRHGMIFVTAANSGNDASVVDRREPLALLAVHNVAQRYRIDPGRVYVGGFSGGSRVAMRLALAYPDLFRGALLNAGSDPIGTPQIPLPPADLMQEFQQTARLVYLTGRDDAPRLEMDAHSRRSMQEWCVFDLSSVQVAWSGHEPPSAAAFKQGLDALEEPARPPADKILSCRRQQERQLDAELRDVEQALAGARTADATALLDKIDARYGGLAAPRSVELAEKIEAQQ